MHQAFVGVGNKARHVLNNDQAESGQYRRALKITDFMAWQVQVYGDDALPTSTVGLNTQTNPDGTCTLPPICSTKGCPRRVGFAWGLCDLHLQSDYHLVIRKSDHLAKLGVDGYGVFAQGSGTVFKAGYPFPFLYGPVVHSTYLSNLCTMDAEHERHTTHPYALSVADTLYDATAIRTPIAWINDARPIGVANVALVHGIRRFEEMPFALATRDIQHGEELLTDYGGEYFGVKRPVHMKLVRVPANRRHSQAQFGLVHRIRPFWSVVMEHEDVPIWPKNIYSAGRYAKRQAPIGRTSELERKREREHKRKRERDREHRRKASAAATKQQ